MKYRKKPVVIDAVQWTGNNFDEMEKFITVQFGYQASLDFTQSYVVIPTLEGDMTAQPGDWVIKGVNGDSIRASQMFSRRRTSLSRNRRKSCSDNRASG